MKTLKKFLAVALALALCALCAVPAFAAEGDGYTVTMNTPQAGHKYVLYQIFTGDLSDDGTTLSNVEFGSNFAYDGKTATEVAEEIGAFGSGMKPEELEKFFSDHPVTPSGVEKTADTGETVEPIKWENLEPGYYLIKDETSLTGDEVRSAIMVEVVDNVEVTPKANKPTSDKKEGEYNPNNETIEKAQGIYNIGDEVPFTVTATIPKSELEKFLAVPKPEKGYAYYAELVDNMTAGLEFVDGSDSVYVNGTKLGPSEYTRADYTPVKEGYNKAFSVKIANLYEIASVATKVGDGYTLATSDDVKIVLTYKAVLTADAKVTGSLTDPSAKNAAHLVFSNDPYKQGDGSKGETLDKEVPVFTFKIEALKRDASDPTDAKPLAGAGFTLYKVDGTNVTEDGKVSNDATPLYFVKPTAGENAGKNVLCDATTEGAQSQVLSEGENAEFNFVGLEKGKYVLVETKTPDGFNTMDNMVITITAEFSEDKGTLTRYEQSAVQGTTNVTPDTEGDKHPIFTVNNKKGSILPSTGGIGTTIFYLVGGALVIGAGVLLFTKKRMHSKG